MENISRPAISQASPCPSTHSLRRAVVEVLHAGDTASEAGDTSPATTTMARPDGLITRPRRRPQLPDGAGMVIPGWTRALWASAGDRVSSISLSWLRCRGVGIPGGAIPSLSPTWCELISRSGARKTKSKDSRCLSR